MIKTKRWRIDNSDSISAALEKAFKLFLKSSGVTLLLLVIGIFITILWGSLPGLKHNGWNFLLSLDWDPVRKNYSAIPFIFGSIITTAVALIIAVPAAISMAVFMSQTQEKWYGSALRSVMDVLAGIPSVIYGFWGLMVLVPWVRKLELLINVAPYGVGVLAAALVLSIMIIPYAASIGREVISLVPNDIKEAGFALGATPFEVTSQIVIPYAKGGIFSGILLSFGRAIGETMAVTMVIGNANKIPLSLFAPANTMASIIANEFSEATDPNYIGSLIALGLILLILTTVIGILGRIIIKKWSIHH